MTLEEILAGESKNLEFKVRRPKDSIKYMKSVVAFANGEGGRIIFGVDDKTHQVEGIPEEQVFSEIDAITEAISDSCEPAIIPDVYLQTLEGKTIIIADISEGRQRPYFIKSLGKEAGVYVRVAGTSRPADEYMIKELILEGSSRSFDQIISTGWNVTDDEINALCAEMKEQIKACASSGGGQGSWPAAASFVGNPCGKGREILPDKCLLYSDGNWPDPYGDAMRCFQGLDKSSFCGPQRVFRSALAAG